MMSEKIYITKITPKIGYLLTDGQTISDCVYLGIYDTAEAWWQIPDPDYIPEIGTYINPIQYEIGMSITSGLWYTSEDGNIWEAIKDGIPNGFLDKEYFDIIE